MGIQKEYIVTLSLVENHKRQRYTFCGNFRGG